MQTETILIRLCSLVLVLPVSTISAVPFQAMSLINPLYTGGLFHCHILDESICHFRGVGSILSLLFYF